MNLLLKIIEMIAPRLYLKIDRRLLRVIANRFGFFVVLGLSLAVSGIGFLFLLLLFYLIFGFIPII